MQGAEKMGEKNKSPGLILLLAEACYRVGHNICLHEPPKIGVLRRMPWACSACPVITGVQVEKSGKHPRLGLGGQVGGGPAHAVFCSSPKRKVFPGTCREGEESLSPSSDFGKQNLGSLTAFSLSEFSLVSSSLAANHHGKAGETTFHKGEWAASFIFPAQSPSTAPVSRSSQFSLLSL